MIKLERKFTPIILSPEFVNEKTHEFKNDGINVWNNEIIKESLLILSNSKCVYCECGLKEESKYMEVEHFEDKKHNPDKVLYWDNLLPSCKRCNGAKSTHDVIRKPIINPFKDNPVDHLYFRLYLLKGKTDIGKETVDVVNLNHTERAVWKRFEVGEALEKLIDEGSEKLELYKSNKTTRRKNLLVNLIESILKECQPSSIYSATCSSILCSNECFTNIIQEMKDLDLWIKEFDELYNAAMKIKLEIR